MAYRSRLARARPVDIAARRAVRAADCRDPVCIGHRRDEREADLPQLAPVAVQEVREVLDVEGHDAAGPAEDRQLLRETQVKRRDPGAAMRVTRHDPAAPLFEALLLDVRIHVGGELGGGGVRRTEIARAGAARDDARVPRPNRRPRRSRRRPARRTDGAGALPGAGRPRPRAGTEGVAVRAARAAFADEGEARLVVPEERLGPLELPLNRCSVS